MPYLLDSDQCIYALTGEPDTVKRVATLMDEGVAISVISYMEVYEGILRSPDVDRARIQLRHFLRGVRVLPITMTIAERCAALRRQLRDEEKRVNARALDLLNAATALAYGLTLVSRNVDDYRDIPGLTLYRW